MMSTAKKNILAVAAFMSITSMSFAGDGSEGMVIGDTMIFSFFVVMAIVFMMIIYAQINAVKGILENKDLWTSKGSGAKKAGMIALILLASQGLYAQGGDSEPLVKMTDELYWIMIGLNTFLLGIIITLYYVARGMIRSLKGEEEEATDALGQLTASLTDAIPIERESEILLDHDYDGIHELDNNLPPWWVYGFYVTIIFAAIYLVRFHVIKTGDLQLVEYEKSMAIAEEEIAAYMATQADVVDESNIQALTDATRLANGKEVFATYCASCHKSKGEGDAGPNLTDKYWKHGGGIENIYNTVKNGISGTVMIAWGNSIPPGQVLEVASYVLTLDEVTPEEGGKGPEGEIWEEGSQAAPEEAPAEQTEEAEMPEEGDLGDTEEEEKA